MSSLGYRDYHIIICSRTPAMINDAIRRGLPIVLTAETIVTMASNETNGQIAELSLMQMHFDSIS